MNVAGTTDKNLEESVQYVNETYYHDRLKGCDILNEGVITLNALADGRGKMLSGGQIVHTKALKSYIN